MKMLMFNNAEIGHPTQEIRDTNERKVSMFSLRIKIPCLKIVSSHLSFDFRAVKFLERSFFKFFEIHHQET